jgi:hypothetical protein
MKAVRAGVAVGGVLGDLDPRLVLGPRQDLHRQAAALAEEDADVGRHAGGRGGARAGHRVGRVDAREQVAALERDGGTGDGERRFGGGQGRRAIGQGHREAGDQGRHREEAGRGAGIARQTERRGGRDVGARRGGDRVADSGLHELPAVLDVDGAEVGGGSRAGAAAAGADQRALEGDRGGQAVSQPRGAVDAAGHQLVVESAAGAQDGSEQHDAAAGREQALAQAGLDHLGPHREHHHQRRHRGDDERRGRAFERALDAQATAGLGDQRSDAGGV